MQGADYAWFRPSDAWFVQNGIQFVCRYLSWLPNGKVVDKAELDHLRSLGIAVCLNWEFDAQDQKGGYAAGVSHATEALRQIRQRLLIPSSVRTPVYFSADWQASGWEIQNDILPYLRGAGSVLGGPTNVGVYGDYDVVKAAMVAGVAHYGWQTYAWSAGRWYGDAQAQQYHNMADWDHDRTNSLDFGQIGFNLGSFPTPAIVVDTPVPARLVAATRRSGE